MLLHTKNNASPFFLRKRKKKLQTNDDAHKKKWESLSPEDKDLFEKNNTAAQHKYCKSLSPEQKDKIMVINAAAHKKTIWVASPGEKARLMETKTEQCHEHLTEEEKKISA
jgi:hypothetical protein